jgi:MFS family permease
MTASGQPSAGGGTGSRPRRKVFVDLDPLRHEPQFRLLWTGQIISVMGNQITQIALPFQVYVLTGSPLAIAALTAVQLLPIFVLSLLAGTVADAFDRRKLLIFTQCSLALTNIGLLVLALQEKPPIWAIYVLAGISASILAVDWPTRTSALPRLVGRDRIPSAIALSQLNYNVASIVGPAVGGVVMARVGVAGAYATDLIAFSISIWALLRLKPIAPLHLAAPPGLNAIREGLRYVRSSRVILSTFAIDLNATILGRTTGLIPIFALDVFKAGATGLGLLAAAPAVGALIGALLSGWISGLQRIGRAVLISVFVWGTAVTLFGLSAFSFELALVLIALSGAADLSSTVLRGTITQTETPDQLRGRVTSIYVMTVSAGPRLGDIRATTVASVIGAQASVVLGGLACIAGVFLVARAFPELAKHRLRLRSARDPTALSPPRDEPDLDPRPAG